jgi:hypothetical protein
MCVTALLSAVFQAFFVSYLVELVYIIPENFRFQCYYGIIAPAEVIMMTMEFSDHLKFPLTRRVNCDDMKPYIMRMMSDGDVATISTTLYAKYLSNEFGKQGEMNSPCSLDENVIYRSVVALFTKGNPLVKQFNTPIRRCLEGGPVERYWAQLNHEALLRSRTKYV